MTTVPVFPLNVVMFPGVVTPLHIFEDRYRSMVRDLLAIETPAQRLFGVVAIREGYEVGDHGMQSAHRVGTLVQLTATEPYDDGTYDIEVTGRQRLRMDRMDTRGEYFTAEVELLGDSDGPDAREEAALTLATFERYRDMLSELRGDSVLVGTMPTDPAYLSYSLAASCLLTLPQRQQLLEADNARERLGMLRRSLLDEMRAMRALPSLPATEVARTRWSPN
ncbi:MAG: LON peptidase substrate-binding domain-containing protein [Actinomycetota bacterium]|nr:LON peptidase substrate-binding domain-containing protein [Actinomycetota bacterium]